MVHGAFFFGGQKGAFASDTDQAAREADPRGSPGIARLQILRNLGREAA